MSETYSVYNRNGTLVNETAICRVVKIRAGVYTWDIAGGSASPTDAEGATADDNYSVIRADITATERAGVPIEWAVDSAQDFFVVGVCGNMIIDGLPDSAYSFDAAQKVLWLECPFENAETWQAYIFRAEKPVNKFAVAEGRARISGIQVQFEKDNRVMRQIIAERFRMLRTPDTIKTLPPKEIRAGKVLVFDAEGNPDLSVDAETVENVRKFSEDAQVAAKIADWAAKEASQASSVATEKMTQTVNAKAQTEELANEMVVLKNGVEGEVAEFNAEAAAKLQAVQAAGTEAVGNVNTAKTGALADVGAAKNGAISDISYAKAGAVDEVNTAKLGALGEINSEKTGAVSELTELKGEIEAAGEEAVGNIGTAKTGAVGDIAEALAGAKDEIDTWSDQSARFAEDEAKISALELGKLNRGAIHYNGGSAAASGVVQTFPFTVCFTTRYLATETPLGYSPRIINIGGFDGNAQSTGIVAWSTYSEGRFLYIQARFMAGGTTYSRAIANFYDGKEKSCVFVATTTELKAYINGNLVSTLTWTASDFETARKITIGGSAKEQTISRVKVFNFDMSAAGAPYTIADYTAGIDEPPIAHTPRNTISNTDPDMGASTGGGWAATGTRGVWNATLGTYRMSYIANADLTDDAEAAGLGIAYAVDLSTKTNPNGYGVVAGLNNTQISLLPFAGKTIKIRASFYAKKVSADNYSLQIRTNSATTANNSLQIYSWAASNFNTSTWTKIDEVFEFAVPASTSIARPIAIFATGGDTASYRIANFQFEVLGVSLLSLADYTFDGEILDTSGNGKHATVSGNVAGTNDTAVETLYQKIAARISNNS